MDLFSTLVVGLIAGWLASRLMGAGGYGLIGDIIVGVIGAFAGGWLATQFLGIGVTGINLTSVAIAVVGAVILIAVYRALMPGQRGLGRFMGR
ncbi:MAG: GlsB/YeaQ/YmgE family stress response membrane protein [Chloroflexota bacterium]